MRCSEDEFRRLKLGDVLKEGSTPWSRRHNRTRGRHCTYEGAETGTESYLEVLLLLVKSRQELYNMPL